MKIAAPAKINLALHVTGQRPDGYHLIESLVVFADAADEITIEAAAEDSLSFSGRFDAALAGETGINLIVKARNALRHAAASHPCPPVAMTLDKNLPLSSGIGGGSADAAATLKGLNDHWSLGFSLDQLCAIGLALGADVPMCLHGCPLIAKGIGEIIEPVGLPQLHLLLVNPVVSVPTPAIFKALAKKDNEGLPPILSDWGKMSPMATESGGLDEFISRLRSTRNDLQTPAIIFQPIIAEVIAVLEHSGALFARMSGSGATCFGIFQDAQSKMSALTAISKAHPQWWLG